VYDEAAMGDKIPRSAVGAVESAVDSVESAVSVQYRVQYEYSIDNEIPPLPSTKQARGLLR
jgi:hypothetical protein